MIELKHSSSARHQRNSLILKRLGRNIHKPIILSSLIYPKAFSVKLTKIKFGDLFQSYRDVFAFTDDQLGKTSLVQHVIDTGDALPIKQRPYRPSPKCEQEIDRQVEDMLQKGIIRESVSPWSSPVVLVKKKDGSFRFCVDLRKVNAVTRKDSFPMPLVSDTLDALSGTKYFSTLDLKSGY